MPSAVNRKLTPTGHEIYSDRCGNLWRHPWYEMKRRYLSSSADNPTSHIITQNTIIFLATKPTKGFQLVYLRLEYHKWTSLNELFLNCCAGTHKEIHAFRCPHWHRFACTVFPVVLVPIIWNLYQLVIRIPLNLYSDASL
jgi:uncharacterized membrane protein YhdT